MKIKLRAVWIVGEDGDWFFIGWRGLVDENAVSSARFSVECDGERELAHGFFAFEVEVPEPVIGPVKVETNDGRA